MLKKLNILLEEWASKSPIVHKTDISFLVPLDDMKEINIDENGEEYITLEQFGSLFTGNHLYGVISNFLIYYFHVLYECMKINGRACCESKYKPSLFPSFKDWYNGLNAAKFAYLNKDECIYVPEIKKGIIDVKETFETYQEFRNFFHPFIKPFKMVSGYHDLIVSTTSSTNEISGEDKIRENKEIPCRCYFVEERYYYFIEFLPNGEGIYVAETPCSFVIKKKDKKMYLKDNYYYYGTIHNNYRYGASIRKWLKDMNDDDFSWKITYLHGYEHLLQNDEEE